VFCVVPEALPEALSKALAGPNPRAGAPMELSTALSVDLSVDLSIDLQHLLIPDPAHTVLLRVGGDSMLGAGILHGDLVVVERHHSPRSGQLVVALLADGFTLKRLVRREERWLLEAAHPAYPALELGEGQIWGVATHAIRHLAR